MTVFNVKNGTTSPDSPRQFQIHQMYVFTRANQSTNHLIEGGANGGLAGADMRVLQKNTEKINIVGIDDHELTGLNVVTAPGLLDTQKCPVIGFSMCMLTLVKESLFMLLNRWNCSIVKLMPDPKLLEAPKDLKHLMDM